MSGRRGVRALLAVAAAGAALAGPVAGARASDSDIVAVMQHYDGVITADESRVVKAEGQYLEDHDAGPVHKAIRHELRDLRALRRDVRGQSASTARGARGKRLVVAGLTEIIRAYRRLDMVFGSTNPAVAKRQAAKAVKGAKKGRRELQRGAALLAG